MNRVVVRIDFSEVEHVEKEFFYESYEDYSKQLLA